MWIDNNDIATYADEYARRELKTSYVADSTHVQCCKDDFTAGFMKAKEIIESRLVPLETVRQILMEWCDNMTVVDSEDIDEICDRLKQ